MPSSVLLCLTDKNARSLLSLLLKDLEYEVDSCLDPQDALLQIENKAYPLILLAFEPAVTDFGSLIAGFRQGSPGSSLVALVRKEDLEHVVPLFSLGLTDVLLFPLHPKATVAKLRHLTVLSEQRLRHSLEQHDAPAAANAPTPSSAPRLRTGATPNPFGYRPLHLLGQSAAHQKLMSEVQKSREVKSCILLEGELGVEFELLAREMVQITGDLLSYPIVLTGAEVSLELLESLEAHNRLMDGYPLTVLLSRVDQFQQPQQESLMAFLRGHQRALRENKRCLRLLMSTCALHGQEQGHASSFHDELLFSINLEIELPPLRDRREDIPTLVKKIIYDLTYLHPEVRTRDIDQSVFLTLANHTWPGNHEELVYVVREAVYASPSRVLKMQHVEHFLQGTFQSHQQTPEPLLQSGP